MPSPNVFINCFSNSIPMRTRFIVITGSIMSGLGKGIITSSIGRILQSRGFSATPVKFDGYLNVDCGTMNPFRHGEVFVLDDGTEVDMDFGTYERFLNQSIPGFCSITGGKLFSKIIEKERKGEFLGRDVQFVPHLTDEIKSRLMNISKETKSDFVLVEVGGTVGDLENGYFLEAMRQLKSELKDDLIFIQLTYLPSVSPGEQKTKPTQHATHLLQSLGIQPDILICRGAEKLNAESRSKLSSFCNVSPDCVFDDPDLKTVYELPLVLEKQDFYSSLAKKFNLENKKPDLKEWSKLVNQIVSPKGDKVHIAIIGKYTAVKDAYVSVKEALVHAAAHNNCNLEISWVEAADLEKMDDVSKFLEKFDGIVVPGGFGERGVEGKISAIKYARENKVPYLGLCLGLQLMVIEYARNVCNLNGATSTEFNKDTKHPVVAILPEQLKITKMGGTMRLGAYECKLQKGTKSFAVYGKESVSERHRHRYEVNPDYVKTLSDNGLIISGTHPKNNIVEIVEWPNHFGVATQPHIELKSRLENPSPIFVEFIKEAKKSAK